jgi:hypothetical protein
MSWVAKIFSTLRAGSSRITRGLLLILWILGLSYVAVGALQGTLVDLVLSAGIGSELSNTSWVRLAQIEAYRRGKMEEEEGPKHCPTGDQLLSDFRRGQYGLPPVDGLLDVILPKWTSLINTHDGNCTREQRQDIFNAYQYLFSKMTELLRTLARSDGVDPKVYTINGAVLPPSFQLGGISNVRLSKNAL